MKQFLNTADYEVWKQRCAKQRKIAYENPCVDTAMIQCVDYETSCGPEWNLRLVLDAHTTPAYWIATISHFRQIGGEVVYDKVTGLPIFEVPQDALLCVKEWDHEENDVANSLLGDLLGPLIATPDQQVKVEDKLFGRYWILNAQEVARNVASRN